MYLGGAKRRGGYYDQQHEAWNKTRHFLILMHFERHPKGSFVHTLKRNSVGNAPGKL